MPAKTHVAAGAEIVVMVAAMFLAEAGMRVTLCEAVPEAEGKARSVRLVDGHPIEPSLCVYTDSYQTLLRLSSCIPTENGMILLDNLVGVTAARVYKDRLMDQAGAPVALECRRSTFLQATGNALDPLMKIGRISLRSVLEIVGLTQRRLTLSGTIHYLYAHVRLLWMYNQS
ncbi:hypothetical protein [Mycobacterium uberis]|uniref:hypothetical protein n=1 Tax=Mycobacterium uberis TaxID=2162698 RepID=UPI0014021584|nr:hypothetical protein [Mycobacterium uberis]